MSLKPRTFGIITVGAAIVIGLGVITFQPQPVLVDLHTISSGPMQVTINADGVTRITDVFEVSSPISGTAMRAPVHVGDAVTGGETIVAVVRPLAAGLLDSRALAQAEASVQEAEAALHVAETQLRQAEETKVVSQSQFDRTQTLVTRNVASLTQLETAAQNLAVSTAAVEAAEARVDMAIGTLRRAQAAVDQSGFAADPDESCCLQITAPADGIVLSVAQESEHPVSIGAPLVSIGDPTRLELVADLLSADAVRIAPGAKATLDRWGGDTLLTAELSRIAPSAQTKISALGIEEQRVDAIFDITSPIADRPGLGSGFSGFLRITEWEADNVLTVPLSALFKHDDDWAVYVSEALSARIRPVSIGVQNDQAAQVLSGLAVGEQVITHPNDSLSDGQLIAPRTDQ